MVVMLSIVVIQNELWSRQGCYMCLDNNNEPEVIRANMDTICTPVYKYRQRGSFLCNMHGTHDTHIYGSPCLVTNVLAFVSSFPVSK